MIDRSSDSIGPDIPLTSVEGCETQSPTNLPRFDLPTHNESATDSGLPPPIPAHLHSSSGLSPQENLSSAASSPSAAYAGLSLEGELNGEPPGDNRGGNLDVEAQLPAYNIAHRAIMGGASELPQRSSSPLKRTAADFDADGLSQTDDVDMEAIALSDAPTSDNTRMADDESDDSVDMIKAQSDLASSTTPKPEHATSEQRKLSEVPSIDAQVITVATLTEAHYQNARTEGEKAYLVSKTWLMRVHARTTKALEHSKTEPEGDIGPVDNSDIIKEITKDSEGSNFVQLKPGLGMESFEIFPEHVWNLIKGWHGIMGGSIPIIRLAHNTNTEMTFAPNIQFEFHPPVFVLHRLWSENTNFISQILKARNPPAPIIVTSRSDNYNEFLKRVKKLAQIENRKVRLWRVPRSMPASESNAMIANTPPSSRPSSPQQSSTAGQRETDLQDTWKHLLLDIESFSKLEKDSQREKIQVDHTANQNYNGRSNISFYGLGDDMALVIDEHVSGDEYVSNHVSRRNPASSLRSVASGAGKTNSQVSSGRNSPAPGPMTRGRAQKANSRTVGSVGLSNLGNTCYMNSALQCVRSVEELTKYFLVRAAEQEINHENPLGHNGEVATAYSNLLFEIFKDPPPTSVAPRNFKNIIGKYDPAFSGYGQQDSQEFLGFLLDGLQEDLSRIKKKPYIEKPDSTDEMINNHDAIREMAGKVWDITKQRDDSIIADLFTGMYKSTLVCPVCSKISITFDPFNNLTLQLPIEKNWTHKIYYFPLNDCPILIDAELDRSASILSLKEFVSERVGSSVDRLFVAEEFKSKFFRIYIDSEQASEVIGENDNVAMYELEAKPTNWPWFKKENKQKKSAGFLGIGTSHESEGELLPRWDDPMADRMIVPVISRRPNSENGRSSRKTRLFAPVPFFIVVTPHEAKSEDIIRRKVLEKVATLTTSDLFAEDDDEAAASVTGSIDPDLVLTTGSDADSSGDGKVIATSIDGEDELVDVAMRDADGTSKSGLPSRPNRKPLKAFNSRRPKFMQPTSFLEPKLQNLFDLSFFTKDQDMIPCGWAYMEEDKQWPSLSSRAPQDAADTVETYSNEDEMPLSRSTSESSNEDVDSGSHPPAPTRMTDEDESSEDDPPRIAKALAVRPRLGALGKRRQVKNIRTYGRQRSGRLLGFDGTDDEDAEHGPLIRLGEGLIADWSENVWDELFESPGTRDDQVACNTYQNIPHLEDPDLIASRKARSARRKRGITLDDCLNEFGKEEILSEEDTWYCPRCKEHRRASKKFELWKTPDILIMHLKRFSSSQNRRDKIDVDVKFPVEGLDLTPRVLEQGEGKEEVFDLFAVDDHWGGLGGGHYTAFAKSFIDGQWYEYNDASVSKTKDTNNVVNSGAYLLFYRRRSEVPLGGPKIRQIIEQYDNQDQDDDESGEDQSLGVDSSLRGSPRALTGVGVGAIRLRGHGFDGVEMKTVDPNDIEGLPQYRDHQNQEDSAPLLASDADMNDGLHESIEDEGIDMGSESPYGHSHTPFSTWNFNSIDQVDRPSFTSGTVSDGEGEDYADRSDVAAHDSSASEGSIQGRMEDIRNAMANDDESFSDSCPVPDIDDERMTTFELHEAIQRKRASSAAIDQLEVMPVDAIEETEEPATEIHVEEGEGLKVTGE